MAAVPEGIILRVNDAMAQRLRQLIQRREMNKLQLKFGPEPSDSTHSRNLSIVLDGAEYGAALMNLPTVVEGGGETEGNGWVKSCDVSQIIVAHSADEAKRFALRTCPDGVNIAARRIEERRERRRKRMPQREMVVLTEERVMTSSKDQEEEILIERAGNDLKDLLPNRPQKKVARPPPGMYRAMFKCGPIKVFSVNLELPFLPPPPSSTVPAPLPQPYEAGGGAAAAAAAGGGGGGGGETISTMGVQYGSDGVPLFAYSSSTFSNVNNNNNGGIYSQQQQQYNNNSYNNSYTNNSYTNSTTYNNTNNPSSSLVYDHATSSWIQQQQPQQQTTTDGTIAQPYGAVYGQPAAFGAEATTTTGGSVASSIFQSSGGVGSLSNYMQPHMFATTSDYLHQQQMYANNGIKADDSDEELIDQLDEVDEDEPEAGQETQATTTAGDNSNVVINEATAVPPTTNDASNNDVVVIDDGSAAAAADNNNAYVVDLESQQQQQQQQQPNVYSQDSTGVQSSTQSQGEEFTVDVSSQQPIYVPEEPQQQQQQQQQHPIEITELPAQQQPQQQEQQQEQQIIAPVENQIQIEQQQQQPEAMVIDEQQQQQQQQVVSEEQIAPHSPPVDEGPKLPAEEVAKLKAEVANIEVSISDLQLSISNCEQQVKRAPNPILKKKFEGELAKLTQRRAEHQAALDAVLAKLGGQ